MTKRFRFRPTLVGLLFAAIASLGCGRVTATAKAAGEATGIIDTSHDPWAVEILVDYSVGSPVSPRAVDQTVRVVLADVVSRPGSVIRLWVMGEDMVYTRPVATFTSNPSPLEALRAREAHERRETTRALSLFDQVVDSVFSYQPRRTPLAESIIKVSLADVPPGRRRTIIILTDALESSTFGADWECGNLPSAAEWVKYIQANRLFRPGSLRGIRLVFAYATPGIVAGNRCRQTLGRYDDVKELWHASASAAGATFRFLQGPVTIDPLSDDEPKPDPPPTHGMFVLLPGLRRWWRDWKVRLRAKRHAKRRLCRPDLVIGEFLGTRPEIDHNDPAEADLHNRISWLRAFVETVKEALHAVRDELTKHTWILWLRLGIIGAYIVEVVGSVLVLRDVGLSPRDRFPLALALAACMFLITFVATKMGTRTDEQSAEHKQWWFPLVIGAYAILIIALTIVRVSAASNEDTSAANEIAMGVVMLFTTIGPALVAELLMSKMRPVSPLARKKNELTKRLKKADTELRTTVSKASYKAQLIKAWDDEAERLRALYMYAYLAEESRLLSQGQLPPDPTNNSSTGISAGMDYSPTTGTGRHQDYRN
jgi:hypothetical protein